MTRHVAFLRAVNLGPSRKVPNAEARAVLEELGYGDVESFANSGNLVFTASGRAPSLQKAIRAALEERFGIELTTFVRSAARLRTFLDQQPFGTLKAGDTYFALFTLNTLTAADTKRLEALSNDFDELRVIKGDVHWLMHGKSTDTTLGPKVWRDALPDNPTTARNTNLLTRMVAKL